MGWQDRSAAQGADTGGARMQNGALCWRATGTGIEVLLITSRDTGRWVIPKGWPIAGLAPEAAAAQEAWEEAGVEGVMNPACLGRFGYHKVLSKTSHVPCAVEVYGLRVVHLAKKFPEVAMRQRVWFRPLDAAELVHEAELASLIAGFSPSLAGRLPPISG
ncbi:Nudix_Hydrolase_9 domain containing protein [Paracoccaceae bacterium]